MKRGATEHPKMKKFARLLGQPIGVAVGAMECLWHWSAKYCQIGDIGKYGDDDIAEACAVGVPAAKLIPALVESGWVDKSKDHRLLIHDWPDHCDDAVHTALARAGGVFANGAFPKTTRLSGKERERIDAHYARLAAERAHVERTKCALDAPKTALPKPSLSLAPPMPLPSLGALAMPSELDTDLCRKSIHKWAEHLQGKGRAATAMSLETLMSQWVRAGPAAFIEAIDHSIASNWFTVHAPKPGDRRDGSQANRRSPARPEVGAEVYENLEIHRSQ